MNFTSRPHLYEFGPFRLNPQKRLLLREDEPVPLSPKAFDTLLVLIENSGKVVLKDDLMKAVWPGSFVEEANLSQNIFTLRKALGDSPEQRRYIATVPGQGYQFTETVRVGATEVQDDLVVESHSRTRVVIEETQNETQTRSKWFWVSMALLLLVAGGVGFFSWRTVSQRNSAAKAKSLAAAEIKIRRSVAVLGFRNLSGRSEKAWLSTAISSMLNTELSAGEQLRLVSEEDVARTKIEQPLADAPSLAKASLERLRVNLSTDVVVLGAYTTLQENGRDQIRLDMRLQDAKAGETIAEESVTGSEGELFELVYVAGIRLRKRLGVGEISTQQAGEVRASLSSNPEAARLYSEGLDKMRAYETEAARGLFVRAVAADPKFALAHLALASAWSDLGYDAKALEEAKRAVDLSAGLSREERLAVEAQYREMTKDWPKAIEIYRALTDLFPDNLNYGLRLAAAQISPGKNADALVTLAALRKLPLPTSNDPRIDLAEAKAAERMGDFKREAQLAVTAAEKGRSQNARLIVADARLKEAWALGRMGQGDRALEALAEAKIAFAAVGNLGGAGFALRARGTVLYDKGDFEGAQKQHEEALLVFRQIGAKRDVGGALQSIGNVLYEEGKFAQARTHYEEDLRLKRELGDRRGIAGGLGSIANVLDSLGDLAGAKQMHEQALQAFNEVGDKRGAAATLGNLAGVLEEQGDLAGAKQRFEQALQVDQAIEYRRGEGFALYGLAGVLIQQDKLVEARQKSEQALQIRKDLGDQAKIPAIWAQLAACEVEQGHGPEAEKLAGDTTRYFNGTKSARPDTGVTAYSVLAQALLAQNKLSQAKAAAQRAVTLSRKTSGREGRLMADTVAARIALALGKPDEARSKLVSVVGEARKFGYPLYQFDAQLALYEIDLKSTHPATARTQLVSFEKEARAKGYNLIARKAAAVRGQ